ncbi:hypothetical protein [Haloarcula pellucida]|uniref:Uncharacterized protein n=1 Tax=Haloarcula pellucida TaxID=1427151 RepID=A0A830GGN9_9EURY|nr:hypothetical protein [Halomicroarcula pellucida]MBX0346811.1 hypothetical protein [Halomicroarcula pellucida]GGN85610.1 hypothetical protein GCM10009030_02300 [Halomicroarcula pellucida]
MMCEKDRISIGRRKILKTSGASVAGLAGLSGSAFGQRGRRRTADSESDCNSCSDKIDLLAQDDRYSLIQARKSELKHATESEGAYLVRVDKETSEVMVQDVDRSVGPSEVTAQGGVRGRVRVQAHDKVVEKHYVDIQQTGNCPADHYDDHYSFVIAAKTDKELDELGDGTVEAVLCGAVASKIGTPIAGGFAAGICYLIGKLFLSHLVDYGGREFTIGGYDKNSRGWPGGPEIRTLSSTGYDTDRSDLSKVVDVPKAHLEAGENMTVGGPLMPPIPDLG